MTPRLGIAIGSGTISASWRGGAWSRPLASIADVREALSELASQVNIHGAVASVAMLPPLVRTRDVPLPPMTRADREAAITRASRRHFAGLPDAIVCALSPRSSIVHAAESTLVDDASRALQDAGIRVERIVPAVEVWAAHAMRAAGSRRARPSVVVGGAEWTTLTIDGGRITSVRRTREPLAPTGATEMRLASDDAEACAFTAGAVRDFVVAELVGGDERRRRAVVERRWWRGLVTAAAAALVAAAVLQRVGLAREHADLQRQRAELRPRVTAALTRRDSLVQLRATLQAVATLENSSPRWSAVVGRVAGALPGDASLTSMRADGDSVSLDGEAENAAAVFTALRSARGVLAVRPAAPIRQETGANATPVERWMLNARVDHAAAAQRARR